MAESLSIREIESAILRLTEKSGGTPFNAAAVAAELHADPHDDALAERIERSLMGDELLFGDENGNYCSREAFFNGRQFVITPDDWEIDEGILFPGHRFAPFCHAEVFPSEISIRDTTGRRKLRQREFRSELTKIFPYHLLLGSEQISDFLIAEHPENASLADMAKANTQVILNVFELEDFYRRNDFCTGDALLCRVVDYREGKFDFKYLSGSRRSAREVNAWCDAYARSLYAVIDRFQAYLDLPEQLAQAFFYGGDELFGAAAASLDEFIRTTRKLEISFDNGHTVLVKCETPADGETAVSPPEGVGISRGVTESLPELLKQIGSPLTLDELDSYILDCCYARELNFDDFFNRAFDREKLTFADDAQEAVFFNYLEDRWEDLTGSYNRYDDEPKGELRATILELTDSRLSFMDYLKTLDADPAAIPELPMRRLAESALYLGNVLHLLNDPAHELGAEESKSLAEAIEQMAEIQEESISDISAALKI